MPVLYSLPISPYAARVRMGARYKGVALDLVAPPGDGIQSDAYAAINPIRRIPCLVDGAVTVPESAVILEYLEETAGGPSLLPGTAADKARARLIARMVDLYLFPPLAALFPMVNPAARDEAVLKAKTSELATVLGQIEQFVVGPYAVGAEFSLADATLATGLFFILALGPILGVAEPLAHYPGLGRYWAQVAPHPAVAPVLAEIQEALRQMMGG